MGIASVFSTLCLVLMTPTITVHGLGQLQAPDKSQIELLDDWLNDRHLDRLSMRLAEIQLARELDTDRQKKLAARLAERYRVQFLSNLSDATIEPFVSKAERLIRNYPEIKTPGLELAICHAKYLDAEQGFLAWWRDGAAADRRDDVLENFRSVHGHLQQQIDWNNSLLQKVISILPYDDLENRNRQQQLDEIESRIVHANYLSGWTHYFSAIVPIQNDSTRLVQAQTAFYRTLRIEQEKPIDQIDSKWLDFSSPLSRRTLTGLALVYEAQEKSNSSRFCMAAADKLGGNLDDSKIWQFNALAYSKQWSQAVEFANSLDFEKSGSHLAGRFWKTVVEAGFAGLGFDSNAAGDLQRLGLLGLLRQFDAEAIKTIVDEKAIQLSTDRFEDLWISGLLNYHLSDHDRDRLANTGSLLQRAIKIAGTKQNQTDVARIRYLQALIEFKLQNPRETIALLDQIPDVPGTPDLALAENRFWLKCRALNVLSQFDLFQSGAALAAINEFILRFPESRHLQQAEFERLKLSNRLLPADEALKKFSEIKSTDGYFTDAQFEMVKSQHRLWATAHADGSELEEQAFEALVSLDQRFRELPALSAVQQLSSLLFIIDASLKHETAKPRIDAWLALAERISLESPIEVQSLQTQLMYYRFLAARKFKDDPSAAKFANWISQQSQEPGYQLAAIAFLAKTADESGNTPVHELLEIYQKLADRLGTDSEAVASSGNARAAAGRLVELYIETNQTDKARPLNRVLLEWNSNHDQFVLNAARIETHAGNFSEALSYWRKLAQGSETGSPAWLESKLGIVTCLVESDPASAARVFRQTINLAGEISEEWQGRFAEIGARIDPSKTTTITADPLKK